MTEPTANLLESIADSARITAAAQSADDILHDLQGECTASGYLRMRTALLAARNSIHAAMRRDLEDMIAKLALNQGTPGDGRPTSRQRSTP